MGKTTRKTPTALRCCRRDGAIWAESTRLLQLRGKSLESSITNDDPTRWHCVTGYSQDWVAKPCLKKSGMTENQLNPEPGRCSVTPLDRTFRVLYNQETLVSTVQSTAIWHKTFEYTLFYNCAKEFGQLTVIGPHWSECLKQSRPLAIALPRV